MFCWICVFDWDHCCNRLFSGCNTITSVDRFWERLDTSHTKNMSWMFYNSNVDSFDTRYLNLRSLSSMEEMYSNSKLSSAQIDLSGLKKARKLTNIQGLFNNCTSSLFTEVDFRGLDLSDVTRLDKVFCGCSNLVTIHLEGCNFKNVISVWDVFRNCPKLESVYVDPGTNWQDDGMDTTGLGSHMFENDISIHNWTGAQTAFNAHDSALDEYGYFIGSSPYTVHYKYLDPKRVYQKMDDTWYEVMIFFKNGDTWEYSDLKYMGRDPLYDN